MVMYLCAATDQMNIAKCEVFDMNTYRHTPLGRDIHTEMHPLDAPAHIRMRFRAHSSLSLAVAVVIFVTKSK